MNWGGKNGKGRGIHLKEKGRGKGQNDVYFRVKGDGEWTTTIDSRWTAHPSTHPSVHRLGEGRRGMGWEWGRGSGRGGVGAVGDLSPPPPRPPSLLGPAGPKGTTGGIPSLLLGPASFIHPIQFPRRRMSTLLPLRPFVVPHTLKGEGHSHT